MVRGIVPVAYSIALSNGSEPFMFDLLRAATYPPGGTPIYKVYRYVSL